MRPRKEKLIVNVLSLRCLSKSTHRRKSHSKPLLFHAGSNKKNAYVEKAQLPSGVFFFITDILACELQQWQQPSLNGSGPDS